ncbi:ATP-binding cassette transporter-like protein [Dendryphion nanum]|uniref:ATP-binding cassette transporter-like protein n=1 Tax=Dendryphion nanum TaxID=256645 RepID=A0A9P9DGC0_9PLEO|nr:ATP-binding cassette transporter-like protein [Dendryphion nanum]
MSKATSVDVEKDAQSDYAHLTNSSIQTFCWEGITVTVKDRHTKEPKNILSDINGVVKAGEMVALMGPSGSGKTTLLNVLAHRKATSKSTVQKSIYLNGTQPSLHDFRKVSAYVEQDDALIGSLTVEETLNFAARLSLPSNISKSERMDRISSLISAFGLQAQRDSLIGTPIRKGVSGGQKRRVSVAAQLITSPKILFLDEPTSGLDSAASFEVVDFVRRIAKSYKILVIASIHQPSTATFDLFDSLILLSQGKTIYSGPVSELKDYFAAAGHPIPLYTNPAEHIIQLVNTDFSSASTDAPTRLHTLHTFYTTSPLSQTLRTSITLTTTSPSRTPLLPITTPSPSPFLTPLTLLHRSLLKSHRDILTYGLRLAMYLCLSLLMGTVWLRLSASSSNIQAFTTAIFFSGAFMSFMAVAYIPSYLEDLALYTKERANGLYGPTSFLIANFLIGIPFLFLIALLFSIIAYFLCNFRPGADGFWMFVLWLFLDLVAAEALVVLIASLVPIFVVALAATAFANGVWMCVGGFMVEPGKLNVFWRYVFHYVDYQAWVFRGMMVNQFQGTRYSCGEGCWVEGVEVLEGYGYGTGGVGKGVGILMGIVVGYRVLGWIALWARK